MFRGIPSWSGEVGRSQEPAAVRTIEPDLGFLLAILSWASAARDEESNRLVKSNHLNGLKTPTENNPARANLTHAEYEALLRVSLGVEWRFRGVLVLTHETGHRSAIRQLRWPDVDLDGGTVPRWQEHEKTGHGRRTPLTAAAITVLAGGEEGEFRNRARARAPSPGGSSRSVSHPQAGAWWKKAARLTGLEPKHGRGQHSLGQKFASAQLR